MLDKTKRLPIKLPMPTVLNGFFHPSIIVSPVSKKTYIVPHWIEVPEGTTMEEIQKLWVPSESKFPKVSADLQEFKVPSSDGLRTYNVEYQHGRWSCTCARYGFRKSCKHINSIKLNQSLK